MLIGVCTRTVFDPLTGYPKDWIYSRHLWLDIWGVWDTGWYLSIASAGYSAVADQFGRANYGFLPLYPMLIRLLAYLLPLNPNNYFHCYLSGLIVSNAALFGSCIAIYKLTRLESDHATALRSVKYLVLFPSAFIFSGVFSESLFVALLILSFVSAKEGKWLLTGILGCLLSLTRPVGILVLVPLLWEYLRSANWSARNIRWDVCCLALIPLGPLVFELYTYNLTGMFWAYGHNKAVGWGIGRANPLLELYRGIAGGGQARLNILAALSGLVILSVFWRTIGFSYWLVSLLLITPPLLGGLPMACSMMRYMLVIFPFAILFAKLGRNDRLDQMITICLALLQGFLMALWSSGSHWIV
jgi:hypothetical protein